MSGFPFIFTFYSYKGGVGRSMALLNVAYELISYGRHVLVIDMDLEAPGVSGFLFRNKEVVKRSKKDVVDMLAMVLDRARSGVKPENDTDYFENLDMPLEHFAAPIVDEKLSAPSLQPRAGRRGRFDVVCADESREYTSRLESLRLGALSAGELERAGNALRTYLRTRRITVPPLPGMEPFEKPAEVPYDYILVDSRTGLTETGGLCVGPLSDRLVVCTGLNDQNVEGTLHFLKTFGFEPREWFKRSSDKPWDSAEPQTSDTQSPRHLGPKPTLLLATPVPAGEIEYRQARFNVLNEKLGPISGYISYHPRHAIMETVFVRDFPGEYISREYRSIANFALQLVSDHAQQLAARTTALLEKQKYIDAVDAAIRLAMQNSIAGEALLKRFSDVLKPDSDVEYLATYRLHSVLASEGASERATAFDRWGIALSDQAEHKQGLEADALFAQSYEKFAAALKIKPNLHKALNNWGTALLEQAKSKKGREADAVFLRSYERFAAALKNNRNFHEALNNWGVALSQQAKNKKGREAEVLFAQSYEKFAAALKIKPDQLDALHNWGTALSDQAKQKEQREADALFAQSYEKFAAALEAQPDHHESLFNWGIALAEQGRTKTGVKALDLLDKSKEKMQAFESLFPGKGAYILACLAALRGQADECRHWLEVRMAKGTPLKRYSLQADPDFINVRKLPWFREILSKLEKQG